ncbi:MAG: transglutaminase-like domain-containing protein [Planctomycetota bacterium]
MKYFYLLSASCLCTIYLLLSGFPAQAQDAEKGQPPPGTELLVNPDFGESGKHWNLKEAEVTEIALGADRPVLLLKGVRPDKGGWSHAGATVSPVPTSRILHFYCRVICTKEDQELVINGLGYKGKQEVTAKHTKTFNLKTPGKWQVMETQYVVPEGTDWFSIWLVNPSGKAIWVYEAHLKTGEMAKAVLRELTGPGVILATAGLAVKPSEAGGTGRVTFALPGTYPKQVPLTFDLHVNPPEALKDFHWRLREDGNNWLCDVLLAPPEEGAGIRWESLVLVGGDPRTTRLKEASEPEAPKSVSHWTYPTACVQSEDPKIRIKADELARIAEEHVEAYVKAVLAFTSMNRGDGTRLDSQDAVKALECGGSRASRANLAAALLRRQGIPARLLTNLATWSGPEFGHWLVEYWHPGEGWVRTDPAMGKMEPADWKHVILNVVNPEDEDMAFAPSLKHSGILPGLPELCVYRISEGLVRERNRQKELLDIRGNQAVCALQFAADEEAMDRLFIAARKHFDLLCEEGKKGEIPDERNERIKKALRAGLVDAFVNALDLTGK